MAIFSRKKSDASDGAPEESGKFASEPGKAAKFFEHARTVHESTNYEYATTLWLKGLRHDPSSMRGHEAFLDSAQAYATREKKDRPSKEQAKNVSGSEEVDRYLQALLAWGVKPDAARGMKALERAVKLDLAEPGYWIGERTLASLAGGGGKKADLVKLMGLLQSLGAFDLAVKSGERALALDPSDGELESEVRNLSAQMTMSRGGYETTGQEGGFRANIRDAERQRQLEAEGGIAKSEDAATRVVEAARAEYESRPTDRNSVMRYARALQERGAPADEKAAYELLMGAYKQTSEFRLRHMAGDIRLRAAKRKVAQIRAQAEGGDAKAAQQLEAAQRKLTEMELEEYRLRVEAYPTDLAMKYELGLRHLRLEQHEDAIAMFQQAQSDPKNRVRVLNYLGQSFLAMGWVSEAVDTFRNALEALDNERDPMGLELRYHLMAALRRKAEDQRDGDTAEEAYRLASGIAIQQINFRDVREQRDAIQALVKELKGGS